ncbi:RNA dependent RNA polymerase-domain-containing protein [Phascolomyces articulosus]|uniref:RNA-dependent RNA polymerase n=1 Tax=Phascolomyces articulosus TaxID=60185 RepID=A0AAD5JXT5_9FUNG|nr:RNA dependent RNA polymerase-domain-containing protein [Phascolomyces articulosus]
MANSMTNMLSNPSTAIKVVCQNMDEHGNTNTMARIIDSGFLERRDPYILNMLNVFRVSKLKDLKEKARIHVPGGAFLLGILDETNSLEEGEIYVRVSDPTNEASPRRKPPIVGPCVIFRNPCFHPGDVRTVVAVDCEKLRHLYDVVVFSAKGFRDLPSMLSGGDLDGDDYTVIWDNTLLPTKRNYSPLNYQSENPLQVDKVNIGHIMKFFVNYINNDNLGQIANSHLAIADKSPMGARDGRCVRLAQLHSLAVDFPKTGRPAKFDNDLRTTVFPDFMQKPDKESYPSDKVLGRMFRYINSTDYEKYREVLLDEFTYDARLWLDGMAEYIAEAREIQSRYNRDVWALMNQYGVYTEAELVSGYVMEWKKKTSTRKSMFEQTKQVVKAVKFMQENYRKEFLKTKQNAMVTMTSNTNGDGRQQQQQQQQRQQQASHKDDLELKAAAWYYVTYHPKERARLKSDEASLFSFPWVVYDYICAIAVRNSLRQIEQKMFDPVAESVIDMHRTVPESDLQVSLAHVESDDEYEEDEEDDEEKEDDDDVDEGPTITFKISDIKNKIQEEQRQQQQRPIPNFSAPTGTYVNIGADTSEEELTKKLLSL